MNISDSMQKIKVFNDDTYSESIQDQVDDWIKDNDVLILSITASESTSDNKSIKHSLYVVYETKSVTL